jgi:SpoVK/Ycf46/Vps4 family AAA+-type ATPase
MMLFADRRVDSQVCAFNRCILLHGPPGTGKTSLSRALAQKISIRLSARFTETILIEVQAASLFSKWFSESAKLVNHLFDQVRIPI